MRQRLRGAGCMQEAGPAVRHAPFIWLAAASCAAGRCTAARADVFDQTSILGDLRDNHDVFGLSLFVGLILFATITALLHLAGRRRWMQRESTLSSELNDIRAKLDRAETFLAAEAQIVIAWGLQGNEAEIEGDLSLVSDVPIARRVLGFGSWLAPERAQTLDASVETLRERGEAFRMAAVSLGGRHLEIEGRAVSGRAVMRIRDVSGDRLEATRLRERQGRTIAELDALKAMLDAIPCPAWARDPMSKLTWVNTAYVRAVEAKDARDALMRGIELLESPAREAAAAKRAQGDVFRDRSAAVVAGYRRNLDIVEVPCDGLSVGLATDISELEALRVDLQQQMTAHARTLDQLSTAVAIFDRRKQLVFHNSAYRQLWSLDLKPSWTRHPSESEILDQLRAKRMLPEQADFRAWKDAHLVAATNRPRRRRTGLAPAGRTDACAAVVNPNPQSGVTYLFDDVTAINSIWNRSSTRKPAFKARRSTRSRKASRSSRTDGRLKLSNAAFARLWRIEPDELAEQAAYRPASRSSAPELLSRYDDALNALRTAVAGLHDQTHRQRKAAHDLPRRLDLRLQRRPPARRRHPADLHRHRPRA